MQITIDTTTELSELDRRVLAALVGETNGRAKATNPITELPSREKLDELAKPKTAAKEVTIEEPEPQPTEKPRRTRKPKPAPEPVQTPEEVPDARPVQDEAPATPAPEAAEVEPDAPTLDDAVKRGAELVAGGKGAQVKAVLTDLGARRVRELDADQIAQFLDALKEA